MSGPTSLSTSQVVSSIVAYLATFGVFMGCFIVFRTRLKRIYRPKSSFDFVSEDQKPDPLPADPFRWLFIVLGKSNSFYLNQGGLDGFFFLRFLYIFGLIFLFGCLTLIVLLPVNATNGKSGSSGFNELSISNILHKQRYYAHVFIGWAFNGLVMFVIYRELFFYNSLKNAVMATPKYASKLSSRIVLFQGVPDSLLDEKQVFKIFNGVKVVYVPRNVRKLEGKIKKRQGLVSMLEFAENKLLKKAVKLKMKAEKKDVTIEPQDDINAYVPESKRPKTKPKGVFGGKVDTIDYCLEEIPKVHKEVRRLQKRYREAHPKNSLIVEFEDQYRAQLALQSVSHHNPFRMSNRMTGIEPSDILWVNLRVFWWEKITRNTLALAVVVLLIIFWAIPVAFVGVISNIDYLTNKLPWLRWLHNMPHKLFGIISGILPTVMLTILVSMVPPFFRFAAQFAGAPTQQLVEMYLQKSYFGFMIVNSFLVTALASSATATVTQVVANPTSAMSILAQDLPKSSNFYISYLTLQGLSISSGTLAQILALILYYVFGFFFDKTVRKKWIRFSGLGALSYGTLYPVYSNLVCIVLAFSMISPIILVFAAVAFFLVYIAFAHNIAYVMVPGIELRGRNYPVALFHIFVGMYLGQVCMIGIFAVGKGWGPIVLQAIAIGATAFCQINLQNAFGPLLDVIPLDVMKSVDGVSQTYSFHGASEYKSKVLDKKKDSQQKIEHDATEQKELKNEILDQESIPVETQVIPLLADRDNKTTESKNPLVRFLRPDVFYNFRHVKTLIPASYNVEPEPQDDNHAYSLPAASAPMPGVWIPKDEMGLSDIEVERISKVTNASNANSGFSKKGVPIFTGQPPN